MKRNFLLSLLGLFIISTYSYSQDYEIGAILGVSNYNGDLSQTPMFIDESSPAGSIFGQYYIDDQVSLRLGFSYGQISGDDLNKETSSSRNLNFTSNIFEISTLASYDILDKDLNNIIPYLYGGIALFHHNPKTEINGLEVELQPLGTEGQGLPGYGEKYRLWDFSVPLGGGLRYKLKEAIHLRADFGARLTFTNYLDDIGASEYANPRELLDGNGEQAYLAAYRADEIEGGVPYTELENDATRSSILRSSPEGFNDMYFFFGIGGSYFISDAFKNKMQKNRKKVPYRYSRY